MYSDDIFILKYMGMFETYNSIDEISYVIDMLLIHHLINQFIRSVENVSSEIYLLNVHIVYKICKCQIDAEDNIILVSVTVLYSIVQGPVRVQHRTLIR